MNLMACH